MVGVPTQKILERRTLYDVTASRIPKASSHAGPVFNLWCWGFTRFLGDPDAGGLEPSGISAVVLAPCIEVSLQGLMNIRYHSNISLRAFCAF